jgi:hypothetical protein
MIATSLHAVVSSTEFRDGLEAGIPCAIVGGLVGMACVFRFRRPAPIGGLLIAIAFVVGTRHSMELPHNVTNGLLLLALAGFVTELLTFLWRPLLVAGIGLAIPGALVLTSQTGSGSASWIRTLVVVTVTVGGTLVADFDHRYHATGWPVVLYAVSVLGLYSTVPDTERALVLLGACLPLMLLGWPLPVASLGITGSYAAVGVFAWVAAFEGAGRRSAVIGGVTCLALFLIEPVFRLLKLEAPTMFDKLPKTALSVIPVAAAHAVLVAAASRIAGLRPTVRQAGELAVVDLVIGLVILMLIDGETTRVRPGRGRATF